MNVRIIAGYGLVFGVALALGYGATKAWIEALAG
jgi:hypothetical protein